MKKIKLKNADKEIFLDDKVYEWLSSDETFGPLNLVENLRLHSSGCAVFQKTSKVRKGEYKTVTYYLHKIIAEEFLKDQHSKKNNLVGSINGNKLDCRLENLIYRSRSFASRNRKTSSKAGYTGVYQENKKFRAVISVNGKSEHLGMFATAKDAAAAYNRRSWEVFKGKGKINDIPEELWK